LLRDLKASSSAGGGAGCGSRKRREGIWLMFIFISMFFQKNSFNMAVLFLFKLLI